MNLTKHLNIAKTRPMIKGALMLAMLLAALGAMAQPVITQQLANLTAVIGDNAVFSVSASGNGALVYQWLQNGIPVKIISTLAGNGTANFSGDSGLAKNASLNNPRGVAIDGFNQIFIGDYLNNRVRRVDTNGIITTFAGIGTNGFSGDGGAATSAKMYYPFGLSMSPSSSLFIATYGNNRIRKVDPSGIISSVAGSGSYGFSGDGGPALSANFYYPTGVSVDSAGNIYIVDAYNNRIRKVNSNGIVTTIAGNGSTTFSGDGGAATNAGLSLSAFSLGVYADTLGNILLSDKSHHRIRKIDTNGIISTIAGNGVGGFTGDNIPATSSELKSPDGLVSDSAGNIYFADSSNYRIRMIDTNGIISTVGGNGVSGYTGDGSISTRANISIPSGIALDTSGNIVFSDVGNNRIRVISNYGMPTLPFNNLNTNDSGAYQVIVSDSTGSVTSSVVTLSVVDSAPLFTIQPTNRIALAYSNYVNPMFTAATIGTLPIFYQWQFNGTNINNATNSNLVITNVQIASQGNYNVVASNSIGSTVSSNVFLQVVNLAVALNSTNMTWTTSNSTPWTPVFSPSHDGFAAAQSALYMNNAQGSVVQTTVTGPGIINFWWKLYNGGYGYNSSLAFQVNGVTQTNMTTATDWNYVSYYCGTGNLVLKWAYTNISAYGTYNYGCLDQVSFTNGGTPVTISNAPQNRTVSAGNGTSFSVGVYGTPPIYYQWTFNGRNYGNGATISFSDVQTNNQGTYSVVVSNAYGTATASATLSVNPSSPTITTQPANSTNVIHGSAMFTGAAKGSEPLSYQWLFNGTNIFGATNTTLFLTSLQTNNIGNYQLVANNAYGAFTSSIASLGLVSSMIVAWGNNVNGLYSIATGITNAIGISAGYYTDLALTSDGNIVGAGQSNYGETVAPPGLSNCVAVSAGNYFSLALESNGTVVAWGEPSSVYAVTRVPSDLTNAVSVSAGYENSLALRRNGTVAAWGESYYGETNIPAGLSNVVAVSEGEVFSVALKNDGTVIAWGDNSNGETNVPAGLSNVVAIAAGVYSSYVLKSDGTVVQFGDTFWPMPSGISNVMAISIGDNVDGGIGLKSDGTVIGLSMWSRTPPSWLTNVIVISEGEFCDLAIVNDGSPYIEQQPINQTVYTASIAKFHVVSVGIQPLFYQWQTSGTNINSGTNSTLTLTNVSLASAGLYQCVVSNIYGSATSSPAVLTVLRSTPVFNGSSSNMQMSSNGFNLQIDSLSGHGTVVIMSSSNLINWQPIFSNPPAVGTIQFLDTAATNIPTQFYRAVEQ
jgi:sugar lactone lactonase YvrE